MTYKILISTILLSLNAIIINGQDLGQSRISNLKQSVVRILVNHKPSGTAFFVREDGWLLTCQHVLEPAMVRDSITNNIIDLRPIHIEFYDGEKIEVGVLTELLKKLYSASLAYDFSLVKVQTWPKNKIEPLKLGVYQRRR